MHSFAGLTYKANGSISAYKVHDRDPVVFGDGFELVFRNGEVAHGCGDMTTCPSKFCSQPSHLSPHEDLLNQQLHNQSEGAKRRVNQSGGPKGITDQSGGPKGSTDQSGGPKGSTAYDTIVWVYEWPKGSPPAPSGVSNARMERRVAHLETALRNSQSELSAMKLALAEMKEALGSLEGLGEKFKKLKHHKP